MGHFGLKMVFKLETHIPTFNLSMNVLLSKLVQSFFLATSHFFPSYFSFTFDVASLNVKKCLEFRIKAYLFL